MTAFLSILAMPLMAAWSPLEVIYPSSSPYNATMPYLATSANGNSVSVWLDTSGTGSLHAATLVSGAVNIDGEPLWVLTSPISTSNVQSSWNPYAQIVGMDENGNSTVAWTDGTNVYVATLEIGESVWSTPVVINTPVIDHVIDNVCLAVAPNGAVVVTWTSSSQPYSGLVMANVFFSGTWRGQVNILGSDVEYDANLNLVAVDSLGNAIVSLMIATDIQAVSYDIGSDAWSPISSISDSLVIFETSAMDQAGNATVVWTESSGSVHAATLLFGGTSFINETILSPEINSNFPLPLVTVDALGNAVAVWFDSLGKLGSARYSFVEQRWTVLPIVDLGTEQLGYISAYGDSNGNVVAAWTNFASLTIQSAALAANSSYWSQVVDVSSPLNQNNNAHVVITVNGDALIVCQNSFNEFTEGTIDSSVFVNIFGLLEPSYLKGSVIENKFLGQSERVHNLTWVANPDVSVVSYRLYRNSVLLDTFMAGPDSFSYKDRGRDKNVTDLYKVSSLDVDGNEISFVYLRLN